MQKTTTTKRGSGKASVTPTSTGVTVVGPLKPVRLPPPPPNSMQRPTTVRPLLRGQSTLPTVPVGPASAQQRVPPPDRHSSLSDDGSTGPAPSGAIVESTEQAAALPGPTLTGENAQRCEPEDPKRGEDPSPAEAHRSHVGRPLRHREAAEEGHPRRKGKGNGKASHGEGRKQKADSERRRSDGGEHRSDGGKGVPKDRDSGKRDKRRCCRCKKVIRHDVSIEGELRVRAVRTDDLKAARARVGRCGLTSEGPVVVDATLTATGIVVGEEGGTFAGPVSAPSVHVGPGGISSQGPVSTSSSVEAHSLRVGQGGATVDGPVVVDELTSLTAVRATDVFADTMLTQRLTLSSPSGGGKQLTAPPSATVEPFVFPAGTPDPGRILASASDGATEWIASPGPFQPEFVYFVSPVWTPGNRPGPQYFDTVTEAVRVAGEAVASSQPSENGLPRAVVMVGPGDYSGEPSPLFLLSGVNLSAWGPQASGPNLPAMGWAPGISPAFRDFDETVTVSGFTIAPGPTPDFGSFDVNYTLKNDLGRALLFIENVKAADLSGVNASGAPNAANSITLRDTTWDAGVFLEQMGEVTIEAMRTPSLEMFDLRSTIDDATIGGSVNIYGGACTFYASSVLPGVNQPASFEAADGAVVEMRGSTVAGTVSAIRGAVVDVRYSDWRTLSADGGNILRSIDSSTDGGELVVPEEGESIEVTLAVPFGTDGYQISLVPLDAGAAQTAYYVADKTATSFVVHSVGGPGGTFSLTLICGSAESVDAMAPFGSRLQKTVS